MKSKALDALKRLKDGVVGVLSDAIAYPSRVDAKVRSDFADQEYNEMRQNRESADEARKADPIGNMSPDKVEASRKAREKREEERIYGGYSKAKQLGALKDIKK